MQLILIEWPPNVLIIPVSTSQAFSAPWSPSPPVVTTHWPSLDTATAYTLPSQTSYASSISLPAFRSYCWVVLSKVRWLFAGCLESRSWIECCLHGPSKSSTESEWMLWQLSSLMWMPSLHLCERNCEIVKYRNGIFKCVCGCNCEASCHHCAVRFTLVAIWRWVPSLSQTVLEIQMRFWWYREVNALSVKNLRSEELSADTVGLGCRLAYPDTIPLHPEYSHHICFSLLLAHSCGYTNAAICFPFPTSWQDIELLSLLAYRFLFGCNSPCHFHGVHNKIEI
jgi:hypothetical protein